MPGGAKSEEADELLALELAGGSTVRAAAVATDMSEATVYRRLADAAFKRRVVELRDGMVSQAAGRLADGMTEAADVLRALLTADNPTVRLRASCSLIELAMRVRENAELQQRIAALERAAENRRRS